MEIWLDTQNEQDGSDYYDSCLESIEDFVSRYERRYHTSVNGLLLIAKRESFYGNWNGRDGAACYRLIQDVDQLFDVGSSDVKVYVDEDNLLHVDYTDHDGRTFSVIKLIPESAWDAVYSDVGCYACELDYVEYFQKKNQLKPTKFWQTK